jgi:cytohesin
MKRTGEQVMQHDSVEELDLMEFAQLSDDQKMRQYPLWTAATVGDPEFALQLAQETVDQWRDVDEFASLQDVQNITPLAMASVAQKPELLKLLITEGADVNAMNSAGFVPLTYALQGANLVNCRLLMDEGANPDPLESGVGAYSPLAMAAEHGLTEVVAELIGLGVNVNKVNDLGSDALKYAAARGHVECMELLINAGANPALFDDEGYSAIHNAAGKQHHDVVVKLLDTGVDVDLRIKSLAPSAVAGTTPLHWACANLDEEMVKILVEGGADINALSGKASTPLSCVYDFGDEDDEDDAELIQYLIDHGANPDL